MEAAVGELGVHEEAEVEGLKTAELGRRGRLADDDDEPAGDVVGAVAVVAQGACTRGVLEQAGTVAQPEQVLERGLRESQ